MHINYRIHIFMSLLLFSLLYIHIFLFTRAHKWLPQREVLSSQNPRQQITLHPPPSFVCCLSPDLQYTHIHIHCAVYAQDTFEIHPRRF